MIELLGGVVLGGIAGVALKDRLFGGNAKNNKMQNELNTLHAENERFGKRNKELERQVEDLLSELNKVRKKANDIDNNHDDLEDELDRVKKELKSVRIQNDELVRKVKEYKSVCEAKEAEITMLKEKIE